MKFVTKDDCLIVKSQQKNKYTRQNEIPARRQQTMSAKRKEELCRNIASSMQELNLVKPVNELSIFMVEGKRYQRRIKKKPTGA